ncbi:MAG: hypothetical protein AB7H92_15830 [Microbacteriaceae bacterium]
MNKPDEIQVTVPFAAGSGTYHEAYASSTTVDIVVDDALTFYDVRREDGTRYYVLHDGYPVATGTAIGSLAERGKALRLPLRTETVSG